MITRTAVAFFVLVAATLSAAGSNAQSGPNIVGKYSGTILVDGLPQPVFVTVANLKPGDNAAMRLGYSQPRDCSFEAAYGGFVSDAHIFYIHDSNSSSICKYGRQAYFRLSLNSDGQLLYEKFAGKDVEESGLLSKD